METSDELTELLAKAHRVHSCDEQGRWSLELHFGEGDAAYNAVLTLSDALPALLAQTKADAARIAALEEALREIDALDPERHTAGFTHYALCGLVERIGRIARAALEPNNGT